MDDGNNWHCYECFLPHQGFLIDLAKNLNYSHSYWYFSFWIIYYFNFQFFNFYLFSNLCRHFGALAHFTSLFFNEVEKWGNKCISSGNPMAYLTDMGIDERLEVLQKGWVSLPIYARKWKLVLILSTQCKNKSIVL